MVGKVAARRYAGLGICMMGTVLLSGCGGTRGFESTQDAPGTTLSNLLAFNSLHIGPAPKATVNDPTIDCPTVEVLDGTASARTYAGTDQSNSDVKYQFSMGDVVRECSKSGNQLVLKVGVQGRVLIGPAGAPGSFVAPVRIAIRNDDVRKVVTSKLYSVPVSVPQGQSEAPFTLVSDPIEVPFLKAHADDDYTILVGFDPKGDAAAPVKAHKTRRKHH